MPPEARLRVSFGFRFAPDAMPNRWFAPLAVAFSIALSACAPMTSPPAGSGGVTEQATIHLVPIGDFPRATADRLAAAIGARFGLSVRIQPRVSLTKQMIDYARRQVPAQEIFDVLEPKRTLLLKGARGVIIGLTTYDMYIRGIDWTFAFAAREAPALAAVSTWRMDETHYGKRADDELLFARLEKMVAKSIGALYLGLKESDDPASGMFGAVRSLEDLDRIGARF